jgi:hypothetical protein
VVKKLQKRYYILILLVSIVAASIIRDFDSTTFEIVKNSTVYAPENTLEEVAEYEMSKVNINTADIESIKSTVANIQRTLNETKNGLSSGATYNINISGNASTATYATTSGSTTHAETADFATTATDADHADTADSATTAEKATKDGDGNTISTTYQKVSAKNAVAGYVNCNQTVNGNYKLRATVSGGTVTYSWVADN